MSIVYYQFREGKATKVLLRIKLNDS